MIRRIHVFGALIGAAVVLAGFYLSGTDLTHRGAGAVAAYVCAIIGKGIGLLLAQAVSMAKQAAEEARPGLVAQVTSLPADFKALMDRVGLLEERLVKRQPLDVAALQATIGAVGEMAKKIESVETRMSEVALVAGLRRPANPLGAPDSAGPRS